jgi:IS30 family transposase
MAAVPGTAQRPPMPRPGSWPGARRGVSSRRSPDCGPWWLRKLRQDWSPEQIAGWLRQTFPEDERVHVSHETIYRSLFIQARGVLHRELLRHLRSQRTLRRARTATRSGQHRGQIVMRCRFAPARPR